MTPTIQSYTGQIIHYINVEENFYTIEDISHGLSQTCRYAGQSRWFYSVAQHSVLVSQLVPPEYALEALMHDATEAYMCDLPTPLKKLLPEYCAMERKMDARIRAIFGLPAEMSAVVKDADALALAIEKPFLTLKTEMEWSFLPCTAGWEDITIEQMGSEAAKDAFKRRFAELTGFPL
ncbi:deoxyribonucleoside 5' monophosphate phosphatase [Acidovorax phage ACP17]|uniref:HD family hydrolase n=1 Tax=Acidovorax phage ACP17 TaxID=2010329 RepID=A0A218M3C6_9CAUD|nr:deoxyribonucleoside 5' monophosphate phosphatase [Acidovorax phage ACP17]ASD50545.1 hypothetical protein [Acidovorax phage ACP17]